jgi:hypothetical protein
VERLPKYYLAISIVNKTTLAYKKCVFTSIPFEEPEKGVIESLTTSTIDAAGS